MADPDPKPSKTNPIPVRLDGPERTTLAELSKRTGIPQADLIRRAVTILLDEVKRRDGKAGWIADELAMEQKIISLDGQHMLRALRNAAAHGYVNFSDYVAFLVDHDQINSAFDKATTPPPASLTLRAAEDSRDKGEG